MEDWKISWVRFGNVYYDNDFNLFNEGDVCYERKTYFDLYDKEGNYVKTERIVETKIAKDEVMKLEDCFSIIQIDYDFHLISVVGNHRYKENRYTTKDLLTKCGLTGFKEYEFEYKYLPSDKPYEISYLNNLRINLSFFRTFDYETYLSNYKKALRKYPEFTNEIEYLKDVNIKMMCGFYNVDEKTLKSSDFDRVKFAIKKLNKKINDVKNVQI